MGAREHKVDRLIDVFHAESMALGEANIARLTRMLGLIAIGFAVIAALASLLWADNRSEVYFVAPFLVLILWMSCTRILAEMVIASEFRAYYDRHLSELVSTSEHRFRSWQDFAPRRGGQSAANRTIYGFVAVVSVAAVGWCSYQTILLSGWLGTVLTAVWSVAAALVIFSAARLPALRARLRADLEE